MINTANAIVAGVGVLLLAGLAWWLHHDGYVSGQAERTAYYRPLLAAANDAKLAADLKTADIEAASLKLTAEMQRDHEAQLKVLSDRESAAAARIADLLRSAAHRPAGSCPVSEAARPAGVPDGAAASDARDRQFSVSLANVGGQCEHDAAALAGWQDYYRHQQTLINGPQK